MPLKIECQKVDTWKKKIIRDDLKGHTYFCQQGGAVFVTASIDHQSICEYVLGPKWRWHDTGKSKSYKGVGSG
ncbi:hypothetical protein L3190_004895 [Serratia marcescens]|nr:hypothetical protein [Serratia marcescens]